MKDHLIIKVYDFAEYPGPRYKKQGEDSGELFYETLLKDNFTQAVKTKQLLIVDLDYTAGYAPSFVDEVFGSLVYDFKFNDIKNHLQIKSTEEPHWIDFVKNDVWPKWIKKMIAGEPRSPH